MAYTVTKDGDSYSAKFDGMAASITIDSRDASSGKLLVSDADPQSIYKL